MKKTIIFDLGGVILNLNYQLTINAFEKIGISNFSELYTQANQESLFDDLETGKINPLLFINKLLDKLPEGTTANQVVHAWNALILDFPLARLEKLLELKQSNQTFLLSNTNAIHIEAVNRELKKVTSHPLEYYFHQVYLSHEVGDRKPNPSIFENILSEHNLDPKDVLFIDDSIQHIEAASKLGIETIHLTGELLEHPYFS